MRDNLAQAMAGMNPEQRRVKETSDNGQPRGV